MAAICCGGSFLDQFAGHSEECEQRVDLPEDTPVDPVTGKRPTPEKYKHPVVDNETPGERKKRLAAERQKQQYEERKAKGLCPNCGRDREKPEQWLCNHCHEVRKKRNTDKEIYNSRRTAGICVRCGENPSVDKRSCCEVCAEKHRLRNRLTASERKPVKKGKTYQERMAETKAKGLCSGCQKRPAIEGKASCQICRDRARERYLRRKETGQCTACDQQALEGKLYCEACWEKSKQRGNDRTASLKQEIFEAYGSVCACCGEDDELFLQIDHVNNDGAVRRKAGEDGLGATLYGQLKRRGWPSDYQLLCANCNFGKSKNGGVCPHKTQSTPVAVYDDYHPVDVSEWS